MYSVNMSFAGQASSYRFLAIFNPLGSTKVLTLKKVSVIGYAGAVALNTTPVILSRITASTGGTGQASSVVNKFVTAYPASAAEIRTANPTVTTGAKIFQFAPPLQGLTAGALAPTPQVVVFNEADLTLVPGEGVAFHQEAAGLGNHNYNMYATWLESPI